MSIFTKTDLSTRQMRDGALPVVEVSGVSGLDLAKTFDCGQCFRFEPVVGGRHETEWWGIAHGRAVSFASEGGRMYVYNSTEEEFDRIWLRYLGLDTDYAAIAEDILSRSDSEALARAVEYGSGIRILRQERWETLCSFIISQNNNIPRIKKLIDSISRRLGEPIDLSGMIAHGAGGDVGYAFPTASAIEAAGQGVLSELKTGFRAKYIYDAALRVSEGSLALAAVESESDTERAASALCAFTAHPTERRSSLSRREILSASR